MLKNTNILWTKNSCFIGSHEQVKDRQVNNYLKEVAHQS